jgi:hypothetical protein
MNTNSQVTVLRNFGHDAFAKKQWVKLWSEVGERIATLPEKEQRIILDDILTAIQSRLFVFEHIVGVTTP